MDVKSFTGLSCVALPQPLARSVAAALALAALQSTALAQEVVEGSGRIDGLYCQHAARLRFDDGRLFEIDPALARQATTVEVHDGRVAETACGQAPRLVGSIVAAPARAVVELTFAGSEWPVRAREVDALSKRFALARFSLRVTGADADDTAVRIALQILEQRPDLLARSSVEIGVGASGWRVQTRNGMEHASSADDVARVLAAGR
jgi:hypothetical protein